MTFLRHVTALTGVGVGGGSLVYANTLAEPGDDFFEAVAAAGLGDWRRELAPWYARARAMLGATRQPSRTRADDVVASVARDLGLEDAHVPVDVGVYFGEAGVTAEDPYFGGAGPERTGCIECGGCMLGCPHGAKNTLDLNYLHLAERKGLEIRAEHEVVWIRPLGDVGAGDSMGGASAGAGAGPRYEIEALVGPARWWRRRPTEVFRARNVVLAGGVLGTVPLLLRLAEDPDGLPRLSARLGEGVRTNSEVLMGVVDDRRAGGLSEGVAITSILRTDPWSTLEPVRYPPGSGFFRLLMAPHAPGRTLGARLAAACRSVLRSPGAFARALSVSDFGRHTLILLYMRSLDATLSLRRGLRRGAVRSRVDRGPAPTASIPEASELGERIAEKVPGFLGSLLTETVLGIPTTAHVLGGCVMGRSPEEGVIDAGHQVFGYPGLRVVDGSAVPANPGVNPSLTITAMAERAMERWAQAEG